MDSIFFAGSTVIIFLLIKVKYNDIVLLKFQISSSKFQIAHSLFPSGNGLLPIAYSLFPGGNGLLPIAENSQLNIFYFLAEIVYCPFSIMQCFVQYIKIGNWQLVIVYSLLCSALFKISKSAISNW